MLLAVNAMVFPCETCDLECEYKKWASRIEEKKRRKLSPQSVIGLFQNAIRNALAITKDMRN